ncbi:uncharacterized protein LOC142138609 isoform X2 [Mixophyes fleayi]|uniref:uncharacterized protein LOC142138609 isoform X2 n=1 Tax=Mixophyes fleayi TaxID=3061075 RepID=UPI003F4DCA6D
MESKKYQISLLCGCLFMWIGISLVVGAEEGATTTTTAAAVIADVATTTATMKPTTTQDPGKQIDTAAGTTLEAAAATTSNVSAANTSNVAAANTSDINCQSFACMGENCYKNESVYQNAANATCSTYCEMYCHNNSYFEARCNPHCMHHMCNDTVHNECSLHCCKTPRCLTLDNIIHSGNHTAMANTTAASNISTTTATTTSTTTIVYSDKKCRSFKCMGADCYKTQTSAAVKNCQVGINHCELQKVINGETVSYEGGCSNTCSTSTKSCAVLTNANCFHECCNATSTGCCMKLDGQVHFNTADVVRRGSVLKIFTGAIFVIFISRYISSSHA